MAERRMNKLKRTPKRVFINNIDSFASKYITKCLSGCVIETPADPKSDPKTEKEERVGAFHVVGTALGSDEDRPDVLEEYLQPTRDELLSKLMACDVVIYNVTQHADQVEEAFWAVSALHNQMRHFSEPKMFILLSTVMTWACTKPVDPEDPNLPFTDELFWRRKAHSNFRQHIELEKTVVKMGKTNRTMLSTYVVASGLQYGMEEQALHFFFKISWLGKAQEIPVFGDGSNIIPMIHINDLASVIQNVIEHQPKPYYILAVDSSTNTIEDILKAIASALGPGKIQKKPIEEAFLIQDLSVMEIDSMLINLRMEGVHLKELFSINWLCESGLVKNIELVVEEYRQTRGLLPVRLCALGPPAVGKSTVSKEICEYYKLHHIKLKEIVSETISQLKDAVWNADLGAENEESAAEAQKLLNSLNESLEQNGGLLDEQLLVKVVKDKLMSNRCRNQGFVLDGFPKTYEQARALFSAEESESKDATSLISSHSKRRMPEFVLYMDASDSFLKDRVMNLPERLVQVQNYEQEHFLRRLTKYRAKMLENETVVEYFDEMDVTPLHLEITSSHKTDCLPLMQKIFDMVGQPRNYGPSSQDGQEEKKEEAEEIMMTEEQENTEEKRQAARWEEWTKGLEEVRQQEEELLEAQSVPMRNYLMEHVMPTLTQGLIECCKERPQDPLDFLAEYLLKNNPLNY